MCQGGDFINTSNPQRVGTGGYSIYGKVKGSM
jgi:hypothetical protein